MIRPWYEWKLWNQLERGFEKVLGVEDYDEMSRQADENYKKFGPFMGNATMWDQIYVAMIQESGGGYVTAAEWATKAVEYRTKYWKEKEETCSKSTQGSY